MFKERMMETGKHVGMFMLVLIGFGLFLWAAVAWTWLGKTIEFVGASIFVLMAIGAVLAFIYFICKFINWLFIEPIRQSKNMEK